MNVNADSVYCNPRLQDTKYELATELAYGYSPSLHVRYGAGRIEP